ncbi:hypothetical protein NFI96_006531, partial [Prochilodus magdalenae]
SYSLLQVVMWILDSPVHPVTEGDSLTLRCLYRSTKSHQFLTADFYRDGSLSSKRPRTTGEMINPYLSQSQMKGLYHCNTQQERRVTKELALSQSREKNSFMLCDTCCNSTVTHCTYTSTIFLSPAAGSFSSDLRSTGLVACRRVAVGLSLTVFLIITLGLFYYCKNPQDRSPLRSYTSFSVFGLPQVLVSDNGPCFTSTEFETFMKQNGIRHVKSAPFHPSTNGLAEGVVQTLKVGLKKAKGDTIVTKLSRFLFSSRITPHATTGVSPAELLMSRNLRSTFDLLIPDLQTKTRSKQLKQKKTQDGQTKLRHFTRGDEVLARNYECDPKWIPAVVKDCTGPLPYSVVLGNGHTWKRHVDQLRGRISGGNQELMGSPVEIPASVRETVQVSVPTSSEDCEDTPAQQAEPEVTLAKPDTPCTQNILGPTSDSPRIQKPAEGVRRRTLDKTWGRIKQ